MCSKSFFTANKDIISGIASVVGILVAIIGFIVMIYQIKQAGNQIKETTSQLQAANEYTIRKDLRELVQKARSEYIFVECLKNDAENCTDENRRDTKFGIGLIFNFHNSVYLQAKAHGISDEFGAQMARDFCNWFKSDFVREYWNSQVQSGRYGDERKKMREEWCK